MFFVFVRTNSRLVPRYQTCIPFGFRFYILTGCDRFISTNRLSVWITYKSFWFSVEYCKNKFSLISISILDTILKNLPTWALKEDILSMDITVTDRWWALQILMVHQSDIKVQVPNLYRGIYLHYRIGVGLIICVLSTVRKFHCLKG